MIDDGVDTQACDAASGVTTSATTGNSAAAVPRGKQPLRDFGGNVLIDDGVDTRAGNVSIDDGVDTQACDADSGITTSGTTGNSAAAVPRGKRPLRDATSSFDSPLTSLCFSAVLGMIFWFEMKLFMSSFVGCVMCESFLLTDDVSESQ